MELSSSNIKKFLIFSQKKAFLIFREMELPYILGNENPEKIPYISGNGTFLYFGKRKPRKNIFIFQETELSYISGSNFPSSKNK